MTKEIDKAIEFIESVEKSDDCHIYFLAGIIIKMCRGLGVDVMDVLEKEKTIWDNTRHETEEKNR